MESDLNLPRRYAFGVEILNEAIFAIGSSFSIFHFINLTDGAYHDRLAAKWKMESQLQNSGSLRPKDLIQVSRG